MVAANAEAVTKPKALVRIRRAILFMLVDVIYSDVDQEIRVTTLDRALTVSEFFGTARALPVMTELQAENISHQRLRSGNLGIRNSSKGVFAGEQDHFLDGLHRLSKWPCFQNLFSRSPDAMHHAIWKNDYSFWMEWLWFIARILH